jgi:hypothetical protein
VLARHVGPYLGPEDLARLDRYQVACRLVVDGRDTTGFTVATRSAPPVAHDHTEELRACARRRGRTQAQRRAERLARSWRSPDDLEAPVLPPVSVPVSAPSSAPSFETGRGTSTRALPSRHVAGRLWPFHHDPDSR